MLKLYIDESYLFTEAIADIKKYYPNIDDDMFLTLIELDPTYRQGSKSAGKYGKWILNLYNRGTISESDFDDITNLLNQFTTYRNRIQNKDLNSYKSLDDLADVLASVVEDDSMLTDRQKLRFLKNVKAGRLKTFKDDDYDIVLDTPNFIVCIPNTHEASMKLGKGTKWCTAHEDPYWFSEYTEDNGKLYIVKNKKTGERWQYSDSKGEFLDETDDEFNIPELMRQDEQLSKFFKKFLGIDYYAFDGTWVYDGSRIPFKLKSRITEIIIDDNITKLSDDIFSYCSNLTSVNIPNSVTEIGKFAFGNCTSLTSISIPNSVMEIGDGAFSYCSNLTSINISNSIAEIKENVFWACTSLKSITIPNSVTEIGKGAFNMCSSLTSINIPNSVTEIGDWAFSNCRSLTVYTNNKYVIDYCNKNNISTKPLNNNESFKNLIRLHIREN